MMIYHLTGGAWGLLVRRIFEAQMRTLPLVALLFVPIGFGLPYIYAWADPSVEDSVQHSSVLKHFLETRFFLGRAVAYFVLWVALGHLLSRWSRRQDIADDVKTEWNCYQIERAGLVLFGITLHFAAIDWLMSLQSQMTSTVFGPLVFAGQILSALALAVVVLAWIVPSAKILAVLSAEAIGDIGSLLFTFLVLWAYMQWFQFMLVWFTDLPAGTVWYLAGIAAVGIGWQPC